MKSSIVSILVAGFAMTAPVYAQVVPNQLSYQGHVAVDGTDFDGNGNFKFALVNSNATTSYWSNDGTSVAGSEPANRVVLPVMDGLYSVALGDTTLSNMLAVPPSAFTNSDVHLRIWFDDGVNGSQLLTPDQPILSVGYAMMAEQVPDGSITGDKLANDAIDGSTISDGSVTDADLAPNSVNSGHIIDGEVHTEDIGDAAVTTAKLADNSVTSDKLADSIDLGSTTGNGYLNVWDAIDDVPAFEVNGSAHRFSAYGSDGKERIRLWGDSYGQLRLHDTTNSTLTAYLTAGNDGIIAPQLLLNYGDGNQRARLFSGNTGGNLSLFTDGGLRALLECDDNTGRRDGLSGGRLTLYQADGNSGAILYGDNGNGVGALSLRNAAGSPRARIYGGAAGTMYLYAADGSLGVTLDGDNGGAGLINVGNAGGLTRAQLDGANSNGGGQLNLYQADGDTGVVLYGEDSNGSGAISLRNTDGNPRLRLYGGPDSGSLWMYNNAGNANVGLWSYDGEEGVVTVRNKLGDETVYLWGRDSADVDGGQIGLKEADGTETLTLQASEVAGNGAQIVMRKSNGTASIILDADQGGDGTITTQVLQITGGSDFSEQFDINAAREAIQPGMIVSIDPENPGDLVLSSHAYDRTAAGVISGAGGVKPGMIMGQSGTLADGKHPVALTGRVYCYVDASNGAVRPGDLLTTSDTPGYGMKVTDHAKAQGAIIGKAMTSLKSGKGLVLVLVSLQ